MGKHDSGPRHAAPEPTAAQEKAARESGDRAARAIAGGRSGQAVAKARGDNPRAGK